MGGAICIHYMAKFNNYKVSKLALLGAAAPSFVKNFKNPYGNSIQTVENLIHQSCIDRPQMIHDFGNKVFALHYSSSFMDWFSLLGLKASSIGTVECLFSLRDENIYEDLHKIKVPTIIMHGRMDQICPYGLAIIMKEQIKNSILDTFEYSGHGLFYDELNKLNQDLLNFMNVEITS